ncbi:MAG: hypothetical protein MPJ50_08005 [Pirellulales bacterium]|nr:hypothetical protein [Pirellulales bacterium]
MNKIALCMIVILGVVAVGCNGDSNPENSTAKNKAEQEGLTPNASNNAARNESPSQSGDHPQENAPAGLTEAEKAAAAEEANALYREAQGLIEAEKYEEGYETAKRAMAKYIVAENDLSAMMLEAFDHPPSRVQVMFNMGDDERDPPAEGIMRPLSFRVHPIDSPQTVTVINFEIARSEGEGISAALGANDSEGHANLGMLPLNSTYKSIRDAVLDLLDNSGGE